MSLTYPCCALVFRTSKTRSHDHANPTLTLSVGLLYVLSVGNTSTKTRKEIEHAKASSISFSAFAFLASCFSCCALSVDPVFVFPLVPFSMACFKRSLSGVLILIRRQKSFGPLQRPRHSSRIIRQEWNLVVCSRATQSQQSRVE